jgi:hypothetical protein
MATTATKPVVRPLYEVAREIRKDWVNMPNYAMAHFEAFENANSINEMFFMDSVKSEVLYFLGSTQTWKGETAKRIKLELKAMVK